MSGPSPSIVCVDCGETAHLVSILGEEGEERVAVYRCSGCWDRWDLVIEVAADDDTVAHRDWAGSLETDATRIGPDPVLREGETADPERQDR
ncbi:MAG: hypothetical protein M3137_00730 [Actinomycetota bacterium]|nr:hypothetical protein [Actinomycetota bacterium]